MKELVDIDRQIVQLRSDLEANPRLLQDLAREMLVENKVRCRRGEYGKALQMGAVRRSLIHDGQHRMWLRMDPDPEYEAKQLQQEAEQLSRIELTEELVSRIENESKMLQEHQDTEEGMCFVYLERVPSCNLTWLRFVGASIHGSE